MNAQFLKSAAHPQDFPPDRGREVAVVGRSNSGKSSAINAILSRTKLARVSKTPGRTQLVNFFSLGEDRRLVDLPGYGYAKVAPNVRGRWGELITAYFEMRQCIAGLIVTIDIRRGVMPLDENMINWADSLGIPLMVLATKADKLSRGGAIAQQLAIERAISTETAVVHAFSSLRKTGVDEACDQLRKWLEADTSERI